MTLTPHFSALFKSLGSIIEQNIVQKADDNLKVYYKKWDLKIISKIFTQKSKISINQEEMDLSILLSQAQMSYSKMNFYKNNKNTKKTSNQQLLVQAFQQNLNLIQHFLIERDIIQLRLVCRGVSYLFIVRDLWSGMKVQVADKKLQDIDDYEFVQEQPKQISKQDKKIRIHSLRKNMINSSLSKKPSVRQASNIKQKKHSMAIIDTELNPFQKTQIGFKRLLKTTNPSLPSSLLMMKLSTPRQKNVDIYQQSILSMERLVELLEIPKEYAIEDLIINPRDQWARNMQRAGNLLTVVGRWNSFHRRLWVFIMSEQSQLLVLMKKMIKLDGCLLSYKTAFQQQPLSTIITIIQQSAPKNALIEQQLNKLGRQFLAAHSDVMLLIQNKQTEQLIMVLHECYQRMGQKIKQDHHLQPAQWIEILTIIEQMYDNTVSKIHSQKLKVALSKSIVNVFNQLLNQHLSQQIILIDDKITMKSITLKFIIQNSQFCQLAFQILYSLIGKITNILQTSSQSNSSASIKMNQSVSNFSKKLKPMEKTSQKMLTTLSKLTTGKTTQKGNKPQRSLFGILWNISKYFDKLQKQLSLKEKKKKQQQKVQLIKDFIKNQSNLFGTTIHLIYSKQNESPYLKSLNSLEEYYKEFKVKIEQLKEEMAKTTG